MNQLFYMEFANELNDAIRNLDNIDRMTKQGAIYFLDSVVFEMQISFKYKCLALENLLKYMAYSLLSDKIALLLQQTPDIYQVSDIMAIIKPYQQINTVQEPKTPSDLVDYARQMWKNKQLTRALDVFKKILENEQATAQEKLTCVQTVINDCYDPEQKKVIAELLNPIYTFLKHTHIAYASVRDVLTSIFRIRNTEFQQKNNTIFCKHIDEWALSRRTDINGGVPIYHINKAWKWICDAIEFSCPASKETLWLYLSTWITTPPFHEELSVREKLKYQFFACEFLLASFRTEEMRLATNFLIEVAENENYSTFIRGDALDVLLRNYSLPSNMRQRVDGIREEIGQIREDAADNQRRQMAELGVFAFIGHGEQFGVAIAGTTFDDSQSVHATEINDAVKESLLHLVNDEEVSGNTIYKVTDDINVIIDQFADDTRTTPIQRSRASAALSRYTEDPAVFTEKRLKLGAVLVLVWNRISTHPDQNKKKELCYRLIEELSEAFNTCATGHLSRIISVLVGYYKDIKQFSGFDTQLVNNIKARINAEVRKAPEDLQGDLFIAMADNKCPEYKTYLEFLAQFYESIHDELLIEFVPEYLQKETFERIFLGVFPQI